MPGRRPARYPRLMRYPLACAVIAALGFAAPALAGTAEPRLKVSTKKPRPGDPVLVTVEGVEREPKGTGGRVPLAFFPVRKGWQAVFAVPLDDTPPEIKVSINEPALSETLAVQPRTWTEEKVDVAPEMAEPPADKRKLIDADNAAVIDVLRDITPPRFHGRFGKPAPGRPTSQFGAWRTLNGDYRSRHL